MLTIHPTVHSPGLTCLAFSTDGRHIYTGGSEGIVRVWDTRKGEEQEPEAAGDANSVTALAASDTSWFSASEDGCVRQYDAGTASLKDIVIQIAGGIEVNGLSVDPTGKRLAVAAGDNEVKIVDLEDHTTVVSIKGHTRGVRRATWHPTDPILVTCGADGNIMVWDVAKPEPELLKQIDGVLPTISGPDSTGYLNDCSAVWHPRGTHFMVVTRTGDVHAYSRYSWDKLEDKVAIDKTLGPVTAIAISRNPLYLAVAYAGQVVASSTSTNKPYIEHKLDPGATVTQVAFSPSDDLVAWTDKQGNVIRVSNQVPEGWPHPARASAQNVTSKGKAASRGELTEDLWKDGDGGVEADEMAADPDANVDDDFDPIDADDDDMQIGDEDAVRDEHYPREMVSVTKAQPPFQPGSTPMDNKKRYLAHSTIGVIEVTEADDHNIVNVEFYDKSTRRGYNFTDSDRYCFAALGERGAVFANVPDPALPRPHRITYKPYSTWATRSEWTVALPAGERVLAVAAGGVPPRTSLKYASEVSEVEGNGCVIVATSSGFVRFFSGAGLQRYVWAIGGSVISMVAGSEWVFVVHREGGTSLDGCQNLRYTLAALDTFELVQTGALPLPKRRTLKWIGITEEGAPAMYDSEGVLSILDRFRRPTQGRWVPTLDTNTLERRKGKDETYWPVGVSGTTFMCLILKGKQDYPSFPRPLVQEIDVRIPLWEAEGEVGTDKEAKDDLLEEQFLREQLHVMMLADSLGDELVNDEISRREIALDKEVIQLLQSACKHGKLQRALDLAALLHHTVSFDSAIKLASFYNLRGLQERLTALKGESAERDRHGDSREERRTWYQHAAPIRAPAASSSNLDASRAEVPSFSQPFGHSARRALAPAAALSHTNNPFTKENAAAARRNAKLARLDPTYQSAEAPSSFDSSLDLGEDSLDVDAYDSPPSSASKRKRDDESMPPPDAKRRVLDEPSNKSANPFARKNAAPKSTALQKSTSFFSKVDAAGGANDKPKAKAKDATKQTTLFGLPSVPAEKKNKAKAKAKGAVADAQEESQGDGAEAVPESASATPAPAPAPEPLVDSQVHDEQDIELGAEEWPPSPPASTATLGNDIMVQ